MRDKLNKICDSFTGSRYDIPEGGIEQQIEMIDQKIDETKKLVNVTEEEIAKYLYSVNTLEDSDLSAIQLYKWFVTKEITLYTALNNLKSGESLLIGLFWAPKTEVAYIYSKISDIKEDRNIAGPQLWIRQNHEVVPPTFFRLNEFTAPFQQITNTYGVPNYKEANPTVFGIVTFPFLFGVMFGDIGHGALLLFLGIFLCMMSYSIKKTPLGVLVPIRYMILLMGFFSTFIGFVYNDFMSLPIEWHTCYRIINQGGHKIGDQLDN